MKAKLLHTEEVAKVLGVSRRTASDLMRTMPCLSLILMRGFRAAGRCASLPRKSERLAEGGKPRQSCSLWTGCWMRTGG